MNSFFDNTIPEPNSGCLFWIGGTPTPKGYGQLKYKGRTIGAHRLAWILCNGDIPDGMHVCHHCDVPCCVNVDHLFLGTNKDNMEDRGNKGRTKNIGIQNRIKTHCIRGHLFDEYNTYIRPNGTRKCRACGALYMKGIG